MNSQTSTATIEPLTLSGHYERSNGTVGRYLWSGTTMCVTHVWESWADVPHRDAYFAEYSEPNNLLANAAARAKAER